MQPEEASLNMTDDTLKDDQTRGQTSRSGFANSETRRNPDLPTADRGEGAQETTISPDTGDTPEDLLDRIDDDPVARDQSGSPIDPRRTP